MIIYISIPFYLFKTDFYASIFVNKNATAHPHFLLTKKWLY